MSYQTFKIKELGPDGDGIHQGPRGAVFVDRTAPGDIVKGRAYRDSRGTFRAKLIRVLENSDWRQQPPCQYFRKCGNCTLMHLNPKAYQNWKQDTLSGLLKKYRVRAEKTLPPLFLGASAKRRRATFTVYRDSKGLHMGYFDRRSDFLTHINECQVLEPRLIEVRDQLKFALTKLLIHEASADLFLQIIGDQVEAILTVHRNQIFGHPDYQKRWFENLCSADIDRLALKCPESNKIKIIHQKEEPIRYQFGALNVTMPLGSFLQASAKAEKALTKAVLDFLPQEGRIADLFSGCGTFTGALAERQPVHAFEVNRPAIKAVSRTAHENVCATERDLVKKPLRAEELNDYSAILLDPPRAGCGDQCREIKNSLAEKVTYVSCNPKTFARDASILCRGGFKLKKVQLIDQFQWTHHMEIVGQFER